MYGVGGSNGRVILHFDGSSWEEMACPPMARGYYSSVWGSSNSDIFAVGDSGEIIHYDGTAWSIMPTPSGAAQCAVWGSSSSDVFSVHPTGFVWHYNGSYWSTMSLPPTCSFHGLWASSSSDYFAVGGEIWHYNGTSWSKMTSHGDFEWLHGVHGTSSSDVFAVGDVFPVGRNRYRSTIIHYDGVNWSLMRTNTEVLLWSVWASQSDVFAVGVGGTILHYRNVSEPVVSTSPATDVTKSSATLNGILTDDVGEACQYRFRYRDEKSDYIYTPWIGSVTSGELFSQAISGLKPNKTYYFNAQAKNSAGESAWGNKQSFIADSLDFEITRARMVSSNELGIDITVRFPKGFPEESIRK